jgi:HlyD family secretion protein
VDACAIVLTQGLHFSNASMATSLFGHEERDHAETTTDVITDQRTGQSCYTIRVSMPPEEVARLGEVKLTPGMPVEAFVQTGDRTMLSYLIKPLHDQLMRAFREK